MRVAIHRQGFGAEKGPGFGGMETQQAETIAGLERLGVEVVYKWKDARVVHLFGIYDNTPNLIQLFKMQGKKVVISTIYWSWTEMNHHPGHVQRQNERFRFSFNTADLLLPNSHIEAAALHRDLGIDQNKMRVVVNAAPADIEQRADKADLSFEDDCGMTDYVLVVGRIEARKNTWRFLRAMLEVDVPIIFVGDCYEPNYYWACYELKQKRRAPTEFFCGTPPPAIYGLMRKARVVAQPSIYETPGLAVLEAAALGVPIAPTNRGTALEYFGDDVVYLDPFSNTGMQLCAEPKLDRVRPLQDRVLRSFTWDKAAEQTLAAYKEFMGAYL